MFARMAWCMMSCAGARGRHKRQEERHPKIIGVHHANGEPEDMYSTVIDYSARLSRTD